VLLAILAGTGGWWKLHAGSLQVQQSLSGQVCFVCQPLENPASATQDVSPDKGDGLTAVTDIRHWSSAPPVRFVIDLQGKRASMKTPALGLIRIYFDLPETALDHKLVGKILEIGATFLARIRMLSQSQVSPRVVLDTKNSPGYTVRKNQDPYRLK